MLNDDQGAYPFIKRGKKQNRCIQKQLNKYGKIAFKDEKSHIIEYQSQNQERAYISQHWHCSKQQQFSAALKKDEQTGILGLEYLDLQNYYPTNTTDVLKRV